jgi:hypothetical protein
MSRVFVVDSGKRADGTSQLEGNVDQKSAQVATICECLDHCFAFSMWCEDFARHVDPDDMVMGLHRAFEVVSDATRLQSLLALRKVDDFLGGAAGQKDDLTAKKFGIDVTKLLGADQKFLSKAEREDINKGVAHLTDHLTLDEDDVDLSAIVERSITVFEKLVAELRKADAKNEATQWLDKTEALVKHAKEKATQDS